MVQNFLPKDTPDLVDEALSFPSLLKEFLAGGSPPAVHGLDLVEMANRKLGVDELDGDVLNAFPEPFQVLFSHGWGEQRTGINYHILRYADVLLMAAEAAVETGALETGRGYVNQVRARAKNGPRADAQPNYVIDTYNSTWTDQGAARNAVRHERRVELAMEGHRLFDLRRWGTMVDDLNAYITNEGRTIANFAAKANPVSAKHMALPIPLNAIDSSQGALTQNPGH